MPIQSVEEARSVARLIKEGRITGPGRDRALADLRAFDAAPVEAPAAPVGAPAAPGGLNRGEIGRRALTGLGEVALKGAAYLPTKVGAGLKGIYDVATKGPEAAAAGIEEKLARLDLSPDAQAIAAPVGVAIAAAPEVVEKAGLPGMLLTKGARALDEAAPGLKDIVAPIAEATFDIAGVTGVAGPLRGAVRPVLREVAKDGKSVILKTKHGQSEVRIRPDAVQEISTDTAAAARGKGEATARVKDAIELAQEQGKRFISDTDVSASAQRMYDRLEVEGYRVTRNPNVEKRPDGALRSTDTRPVYGVAPPLATAADINIPRGRPGFLGGISDAIATRLGPTAARRAAERQATGHQAEITGNRATQADLVNALEAPGAEIVPGSRPRVGELVAETPGGAGLFADEALITRQPGEPNAAFARRLQEREAARESLTSEALQSQRGQREAALTRANELGAADARLEAEVNGAAPEAVAQITGIKSGAVRREINNMLREPALAASEVTRKTLLNIRFNIERLMDPETGLIDARGLDTIRKEIGNKIAKFSKETATWDKKKTAGLTIRIQKLIDDAIENAGGKGYRASLKEFSTAMRKVSADIDRSTAKPSVVATTVGHKLGIENPLPNTLSRGGTIFNAVVRIMGKNVDELVAAELARRYLNPAEMARILRGEPPTPSMLNKITRGAAVSGLAGATIQATQEEKRRAAQVRALRGE